MPKEQDSLKINGTGLEITPQYLDELIDGYQPLLADEANTILSQFKECLRQNFIYEAEIDNLRACIKCEKMPEGYDVNDDATTELAVELAQSQLETSCMVEDSVHKTDCLRVAAKALEDIRATCISSPYWHNQVSHAPAHLQNVARALLRHHKIVTDAQKEIENKNRAILET